MRDVRGGRQIESGALLRSGDAAGAGEKAQRALDASRRRDYLSAKSIADTRAALQAMRAQ